MADKIIEQRETHNYTFHGHAVDEIRKALVLGLFLACEVDRVQAEVAATWPNRKDYPKDCVPRDPDDRTIDQIANALLWVEMNLPYVSA